MKNKNTPIILYIDNEILKSEIEKQQELSKIFWESTTPGDDNSFDIVKFLNKTKEMENKDEK